MPTHLREPSRSAAPLHPGQVAGINRNRWPLSSGLGGWIPPDWVAGFGRNAQFYYPLRLPFDIRLGHIPADCGCGGPASNPLGGRGGCTSRLVARSSTVPSGKHRQAQASSVRAARFLAGSRSRSMTSPQASQCNTRVERSRSTFLTRHLEQISDDGLPTVECLVGASAASPVAADTATVSQVWLHPYPSRAGRWGEGNLVGWDSYCHRR